MIQLQHSPEAEPPSSHKLEECVKDESINKVPQKLPVAFSPCADIHEGEYLQGFAKHGKDGRHGHRIQSLQLTIGRHKPVCRSVFYVTV